MTKPDKFCYFLVVAQVVVMLLMGWLCSGCTMLIIPTSKGHVIYTRVLEKVNVTANVDSNGTVSVRYDNDGGSKNVKQIAPIVAGALIP